MGKEGDNEKNDHLKDGDHVDDVIYFEFNLVNNANHITKYILKRILLQAIL